MALLKLNEYKSTEPLLSSHQTRVINGNHWSDCKLYEQGNSRLQVPVPSPAAALKPNLAHGHPARRHRSKQSRSRMPRWKQQGREEQEKLKWGALTEEIFVGRGRRRASVAAAGGVAFFRLTQESVPPEERRALSLSLGDAGGQLLDPSFLGRTDPARLQVGRHHVRLGGSGAMNAARVRPRFIAPGRVPVTLGRTRGDGEGECDGSVDWVLSRAAGSGLWVHRSARAAAPESKTPSGIVRFLSVALPGDP
jgi:hypothetical protein